MTKLCTLLVSLAIVALTGCGREAPAPAAQKCTAILAPGSSC